MITQAAYNRAVFAIADQLWDEEQGGVESEDALRANTILRYLGIAFNERDDFTATIWAGVQSTLATLHAQRDPALDYARYLDTIAQEITDEALLVRVQASEPGRFTLWRCERESWRSDDPQTAYHWSQECELRSFTWGLPQIVRDASFGPAEGISTSYVTNLFIARLLKRRIAAYAQRELRARYRYRGERRCSVSVHILGVPAPDPDGFAQHDDFLPKGELPYGLAHYR